MSGVRKNSPKANLLDFIKKLDEAGLVRYHTFDGFIYEVDSEESYSTILPPAESIV
jgi:hypothetical protein